MTNIISCFLQGRMNLMSDYFEPDSDYETALREALSMEGRIKSELSDENKSSLDQLISKHDELNEISNIDNCAASFCLGIMLILELQRKVAKIYEHTPQ